MAKVYLGRTEQEKEFIAAFQKLCNAHAPWEVWADFVRTAACSISNAVGHAHAEEREQEYAGVTKRYSKEEMGLIASMMAAAWTALRQNPAQDFLGELYMYLKLYSHWKGQFFTPWPIAYAMAQIAIGNGTRESIAEKGYVAVYDPACGAGCILLAAAQACAESKDFDNYKNQLFLVGQDIDRVVAQMCYVQMSLLGLAGYVIVGDSIASPPTGIVLLPRETKDTEIWYTPAMFSKVWIDRTEREIKEAEEAARAATPETSSL